MNSCYVITSESPGLLERLFAQSEDGRLSFGVAGESVEPASIPDLLAGEVRFRAHVMEGNATYDLSARETKEGLTLTVRNTAGARAEHVDWFVQRQIESEGCHVHRAAL